MRGYEEIGERSFYERSLYFSIRMKHLMILTSLIILLVIGIGVAILFIVENKKCKYLIMYVFILFITCQQPILNSESTNFFHLFFVCFFFYFKVFNWDQNRQKNAYITGVFINKKPICRTFQKIEKKTLVDSELKIGCWHVMNNAI